MSEIYNAGHDAHFRFGELIVYDAPLDVVNRNTQLRTLKQKWGLSVPSPPPPLPPPPPPLPPPPPNGSSASAAVQVLFAVDFDSESGETPAVAETTTATSWRGIALQSENDGGVTGALGQLLIGNPAAWTRVTSTVCHGGKGKNVAMLY